MASDSVPDEVIGQPPAIPAAQTRIRVWPAARVPATLAAPIALYLLALVPLLFRLAAHPDFPYNWETYTARDVLVFVADPSRSIFHLTDGVMTDSGLSPLMAGPIWLSFRLFGASLLAMRLPIALLAALAVPLTWLVGRRLAGSGVATLGAALLALSPVFLLYARTATLVGISLVPMLATVYALLRVLDRPRFLPWLLALQALLLLGAYSYTPVRFLWPLSLILLAGELVWRRGERRRLLLALAVTAVVLPLAVTGAYRFIGYQGWDTEDPAIVSYYSAHGEQLANLRDDPIGLETYVRDAPADPGGSATRLAIELVRQNAVDLGRLLADRQTAPAITDYWNPRGRLYPWFLVPFFVIGCLVVLRRALGRPEARAWLVLFWGFALPMVFTSRVHIGRLNFIVPLLMLLVALGLVWSGQAARRLWAWLSRRRGWPARPAVWRTLAAIGLTVALLAVAHATWADYRIAPPEGQTARIAAVLRDPSIPAPDGAGYVLVLAERGSELEGEGLTVSALQVMVNDDARFVNLRSDRPPAAADGRRTVYFGGVLLIDASAAAPLPTFCQNVYIVPENRLDRFTETFAAEMHACPAPPRVIEIPT